MAALCSSERVFRSDLQLKWRSNVYTSAIESTVREIECSERVDRCLARAPPRPQGGCGALIRAHAEGEVFEVPNIKHVKNYFNSVSFANLEVPADSDVLVEEVCLTKGVP